MGSIIRKIGVINSILIVILLFLWLSLFFIHGLAGAYAWALLKMILPFFGMLGVLIHLFLIIFFIVKKKKLSKVVMNFMVSVVFAFPILMTLNIIPFAYPVNIQRVSPSITVNWPMAEQTVVGWGGDTTKDNLPHVIWSSERWAYDLVMEPYDIGSKKNEDYGIWNKEVYSPVSGTVVAANDDEADIEPGTEEFISMEGNYVILKSMKQGHICY